MNSVMNFYIHEYPFDYWRFIPEALKSLLRPFESSWANFAGKTNLPRIIVGVGFMRKSEKTAMEPFEQRIKHWKQRCHRRQGKGFFHDTNMGKTYRRKDNSIGLGWDNDRGVIRAVEEYLNTRLDETRRFMRVENNWTIEHYPYSSGFTVLTKI